MMDEELIPVCVYADSTGLYTEEEYLYWNLCDIMFPKWIVMKWYEGCKKTFKRKTAYELGVPESEVTFDMWYNDVYTADDTEGLYDFAVGFGFVGQKDL